MEERLERLERLVAYLLRAQNPLDVLFSGMPDFDSLERDLKALTLQCATDGAPNPAEER